MARNDFTAPIVIGLNAPGDFAARSRSGGTAMKLLVGLGNPGAVHPQPAQCRLHGGRGHRRRAWLRPWRAKFHGLVAEGRIGAEKALLLKPGTFMNLSGDAALAAMTSTSSSRPT